MNPLNKKGQREESRWPAPDNPWWWFSGSITTTAEFLIKIRSNHLDYIPSLEKWWR